MFVFRSCFCEGDARKLLILNWLGIALQFYRQIKPKKSLRLESAGEGWFEFDGLEVTDSAPNTKAGLKAESFLRKRLILASNRPLNGRIKVFPEIREQRSENRDQRSGGRDQRSGVRDQRSEIRGQGSVRAAIFRLPLLCDGGGLFSASTCGAASGLRQTASAWIHFMGRDVGDSMSAGRLFVPYLRSMSALAILHQSRIQTGVNGVFGE
jgi:hypothetical protein